MPDVGPAYAKPPRDTQRDAVDQTFRDLVENAHAIKGSVFDTPMDAAMRDVSDPMRFTPGVVVNPGNALYRQISGRMPKMAKALQAVSSQHEYMPQVPLKTMPEAWGMSVGVPTGMREAIAQGKAVGPAQPGGLTGEQVISLAKRPEGSTYQMFPKGKVADETLAHEGYHALYSKKFPVTQAPMIGETGSGDIDRALKMGVRVMKRSGATEDEIMAWLATYLGEPEHGIVHALGRYQAKKTGGTITPLVGGK
jgi:hypothetical protein